MSTLKEYLGLICVERNLVVKLSNENLKKYKNNFYSLPFKIWQLDLLWEYIWGDISLKEIKKIFRIGEYQMKNYKVKTKVKNNFNDTKTNITYEKNDDIILDRARYEELLSKGFVEEGKILEDKPLFKKEIIEDKED